MLPDKIDAGYLWDMLDAAEAVSEFVSGYSFDGYLRDRKLRGAVERHVEIIGEAARRVSQPLRDSHPEVPWQRIISQRNVLAHEYGDLEHKFIWTVATVHIPKLIAVLKPLVPAPPEPGP